ncbi:tetraacyldisaccharide 4'-kinase [Thiomonas sp.]|uniref:tetraacyldisaccharide 4'-kinase n=1 Tax=Thiomonas sp. TaxID=2047785 RepID=UPI002624D2A9|nr:tetraacyldisaccharide 4'-kinase [Thiomonas sp.]
MSASAADTGWPRCWQQRTALSGVLWPLSRLFAAVSALRRAGYRHGLLRATRVGVPVVVVGNLTVGGAGKTPVIAALATALRQAGWQPGVISRGYGGRGGRRGSLPVHADSDPVQCGDEPVLLARLTGCPVQVGRDRAQAARDLLSAHAAVDVLLSDDGLQHLALARDVELVVVDARRWGNGLLLPAGPLREPVSRQRDATLGPAAVLAEIAGGGRHFAIDRHLGDITHLTSGERLNPEEFAARYAGQSLGALAGIGHPGQFFAMLRAAGLAVQGAAVGDHQALREADFSRFPPACPVLVTEKDAIKSAHLPPALRQRMWVAGLRLNLPADLLPWLEHKLENARGLPTS